MFTEARKIQLLKDVLKLSNENTLVEIEAVIKKSTTKKAEQTKSAHEFAGLWSKKDAALIEKAIAEGCNQIHEDDWK
jgi:hypothetical protein